MRALDQRHAGESETFGEGRQKSTASRVYLVPGSSRLAAETRIYRPAVVSFYPIPKNFPGSFVLAADGRRVSLSEWVTQAPKKQDLPTKGRRTIHNAKTDGILVD
jgi:hypothetical protein